MRQTSILRKKGLASAAKKAGRATGEGLIGSDLSADHSQRHPRRSELRVRLRRPHRRLPAADQGCDRADRKGRRRSALRPGWSDPSGPVHLRVAESIGKLGENMAVPRFVRYAGQGYVAQYTHLGGKIAVQVEFSGVTPAIAAHADFPALTKEIAMQIAAASPSYATRAAVPADLLDREKAIYRSQMEDAGKPANVIEKIVEGKLESFYATVRASGSAVHPGSEDDCAPGPRCRGQIARGDGCGQPLRPAQGRRNSCVGPRSIIPPCPLRRPRTNESF